jgi:hypothetical protein
MKNLLHVFLLIVAGILMFMFVRVDILLLQQYQESLILLVIFNLFTLILFGAFYRLFADSFPRKQLKRVVVSTGIQKG